MVQSRSPRPLTRFLAALLAVALTALMVTMTSTAPAQAASKLKCTGWLPYWAMGANMATIQANPACFEDVSPFSAGYSGGNLKLNSLSDGWSWASVTATLHGLGIKVWPSITDDNSAGVTANVLKNPTKRAAHEDQIVNLVTTNGFDGIDLDYEKFAFNDGASSWPQTKDAWTSFVCSLAAKLHANGKSMSVAVPPMYNGKENGTSGYWVYNYAGIGGCVDELRIMAYDYSWDSPGPVGGPLPWVENILQYATSVVTPSKVFLGSPTYGRDWVKSKGGSGCPSTGQKVYDSKNMATAIADIGLDQWLVDPNSGERYVDYKLTYNGGKCKVTRSAWMADNNTQVLRAQLAAKYGAGGMAFWTVGGAEATMWNQLRDLTLSTPKGTPLKVTYKKSRSGAKLVVNGKVKPKSTAGSVQLQIKKKGSWTIGKTKALKPGGSYRISKKMPSNKRVRVVVLGTDGSSGATKGFKS